MNDSRMVSITQIKDFIKVAKDIKFQGASRKEKYEWIEIILLRFGYFSCRKKDKSTLKQYMMRMTGFSDAQLTRLVAKKKKSGKILVNTTRHYHFPKKYTPEDIGRLIETDKVHDHLSGPATKKILEREYAIFKKEEFIRLKDISSSHIYNLRETRQYQSNTHFFARTRPNKVNIGERAKPEPEGKPGFLRVDTVHQGDLDKKKGIYHINLIDEVTQWEILASVEKISEYYLLPLLEDALDQFPFGILGFHSDNGSEFINKVVAALLNKLLIYQTKSRARHCNDNALVEGKNGSIVRKHIGYQYISQRYASLINEFYKNYLNVYLNYHRPCGFAEKKIDNKGKEKKVYNLYLIPYEALKSHPRASDFLRDGIFFEKLDKIAYQQSDNECASSMQKAKDKLFAAIGKDGNNLDSNHYMLSARGRSALGGQFHTAFTRLISGSYVD
jgi:hypothetical protein